jgi:hypothetical protein
MFNSEFTGFYLKFPYLQKPGHELKKMELSQIPNTLITFCEQHICTNFDTPCPIFKFVSHIYLHAKTCHKVYKYALKCLIHFPQMPSSYIYKYNIIYSCIYVIIHLSWQSNKYLSFYVYNAK